MTQRHCYMFTNCFIYAATIIIMSNDFWAFGSSGWTKAKSCCIHCSSRRPASCQTQIGPYMEKYTSCCVSLRWLNKILFFTSHKDEVHLCGGERRAFSDSLLSPIIQDQSQKNVGEKSVDNNGETRLRFGAFVCCAGTGPRSGSNARNERCPHFSFELICSVTHCRTKARTFMGSRTHRLRHYPHSAVQQRVAFTHVQT